ncbi:MAG: YkgJ family cysteine cluster protein [Promethearchaeota archaeon]|nr:MAG: YkgJ family cysteine cluster protein [Candidatus Lokiarchaeota archaeon]
MNDSSDSSKELRFACTRCGNCCTDQGTIVNVTYSDILRIKNGLKLSGDELLEVLGFYWPEKEIDKRLLQKMMIPPIKTEKGWAFIGLFKKNDGRCYFYDEDKKKCLIYELRPSFCRTFPFSFKILFDKKDKTKAKIKMYYTEKGKQYCPGIGPDAPVIDGKQWIKLGKKTLEDINENNIVIQKWNENVDKGLIKPSVKKFLQLILNLDKNKTKT